jgi:hypothetical protein
LVRCRLLATLYVLDKISRNKYGMNRSTGKRYKKIITILAFIGESECESERGTKGVEREGEERGDIGQVGEEEWLLQSTLSQ